MDIVNLRDGQSREIVGKRPRHRPDTATVTLSQHPDCRVGIGNAIPANSLGTDECREGLLVIAEIVLADGQWTR